jgi:hypothetical protein
MRKEWGILTALWETYGSVESGYVQAPAEHRGLELAIGDAHSSPNVIAANGIGACSTKPGHRFRVTHS